MLGGWDVERWTEEVGLPVRAGLAGAVQGGEAVGEEEHQPLQLPVVHGGRRGGGPRGGEERREQGGEGVEEAGEDWAVLVAALAEGRQLQHGSGGKGRESDCAIEIFLVSKSCFMYLSLLKLAVWLVVKSEAAVATTMSPHQG